MQPTGPLLPSQLAPGSILGGKYRVVRVIGQGGMGMVLLAHHEELDQDVAIKVVLGDLAQNAEIAARFQREARAAAKLQSDHVVRVTDVGKFAGIGPYMVMEHLNGLDLGQLLERRGPLPTAEAVDYLLEAIDALAEAHALGIVHRDLKPSNLFVAERNDGARIVKVLDFGISKVDVTTAPANEQKLTSTRAVMGSPAYMPPEQLKSARDVDGRADVWSLGIVLYELLTQALPFDGDTVGALFAAIIESAPRPLRGARPDVPPQLEGIVMRCLRRDPRERYANVGDLAQALAPFGSGRARKQVERAAALSRQRVGSAPSLPSAPAAVPAPGPAPAAAIAATQNAWGTPAGDKAQKRPARGALVAVAVAGAALVVGGAAWLARGRAATSSVSPPAASTVAAGTAPASATAPALASASASPAASASAPADSTDVTAAAAAPSASASASAAPQPGAPRWTKPTGPAATPPNRSPSFLDRQR